MDTESTEYSERFNYWNIGVCERSPIFLNKQCQQQPQQHQQGSRKYTEKKEKKEREEKMNGIKQQAYPFIRYISNKIPINSDSNSNSILANPVCYMYGIIDGQKK